jgi:hypothetical protein
MQHYVPRILLPWPHFREDWPIRDMMELHDAIVRYCHQIIPYESSIAMAKNIMSDLFLISGYTENKCPNIADVVIHLVSKKICDLSGNTRIVYNKNHVKHFQTLPWWFKSSTLANYAEKQQSEEEDNQNELESDYNECESTFDRVSCNVSNWLPFALYQLLIK